MRLTSLSHLNRLWPMLVSALLLQVACSTDTPPVKPKNDHLIRFVTVNSPNTYYIDSQNNLAGLEYDLAQRFQEYLGPEYQVDFIVVDSFSKVLEALDKGDADIAAADLTITPKRQEKFDFSDSYFEVQPQLTFLQDLPNAPKKLSDAQGHIISLPKGTSFVERLEKLNANLKPDKPHFVWEELEHGSSEQVIEKVVNGEVNYTIADSHLLSIMHYQHPELSSGINIGEPEKIAWAIKKGQSPEKLQQINTFFNTIKRNGKLRNIIDRYHGYTKRLNPLDVSTFLSRTRTLLPKYTHLFKSAQEVTEIDWRLLAALSYQESHWDTYSTSPTNVRGLMMLTESTSDMMNVTDRLDPNQSVMAGAKFLLWLKDRIPERIPEPDRTFMTIASYNIGVGHLEDARVLAQSLKLNPDSWADVKKALVLLNDPTYYINAKHGYCSCGAPVIYTESIRSYYKILEKHTSPHERAVNPYNIEKNDNWNIFKGL